MENRPGDKAKAEDYLFIADADRVLHDCQPAHDWRQRLEDDYNNLINEYVEYGTYTPEQGELFKLEYHRGLYHGTDA